jgi:hypothetical protein
MSSLSHHSLRVWLLTKASIPCTRETIITGGQTVGMQHSGHGPAPCDQSRDLRSQVTFAILAIRAADCRVREQIVVIIAKVRQRTIAPVALQVADQLPLLCVAPGPVTEGLQDRVDARTPPRV